MENISHSGNDSNNSIYVLIEPQETWYWTIKAIIAFFAIVGNGLVIYLIVSKRRLRVTKNWFVLSLAIADFFIGLITTSTGIFCTFGHQCDWRLQIGIYNFLLYASTSNLWAMAIDRYIGVVYPLRYMSLMTFKRASVMIAISWLISFLAAFVRLFWLYGEIDNTIDKYYRMVIDLLFGVFSCVMLVTVYARILYICREKLRQSNTQLDQVIFNHSSSVPQCLKKARKNSSAKVLGSVVFLFVTCYSLSIFVSFCSNFGVCHLSPLVKTIALLLVHLNSAVNFVVYALMKKDIRQELQRFWRPMRCDSPARHFTESREDTLV
ncbi:adenosine receptor A3-like [Stylophora pistillata]|uniref:adenosine receptor A3-like n=1 Tax=Stylophora pistillata TaxID=50429 RepID=UPI000C047498|nr:adenosine receptor A3-like [Stylophora pistillata]